MPELKRPNNSASCPETLVSITRRDSLDELLGGYLRNVQVVLGATMTVNVSVSLAL